MRNVREVERCLRAIQANNRYLNAFTNIYSKESLLHDCILSEDRNASGSPLSSIDGLVIALKDNISARGLPTTCASETLRDYTPPFDATIVTKLRKSGAIIIGKTNMDEFGMGSHSIHSAFGPVKAPREQDKFGEAYCSAGGSSGGSAISVASNWCHAALGTDTGGSVRLPAAYCGIVGLKPSYGRLSRWGVVAYSNSLDTVGILAKNSSTVRHVFDAIDGYDDRDPTSMPRETRDRIDLALALRRDKRKSGTLCIGVPIDYNLAELDISVVRAWRKTIHQLSSLGHSIMPVKLPNTRNAISAYYVLATAEASSNLAKYDGLRYGRRNFRDWSGGLLFAESRKVGFGDEVRRRILLGTYSLSAEAIDNYFIRAQSVRRLVQRDFNTAFALGNAMSNQDLCSEAREDSHRADVLIAPCSLTKAPLLEDVKTQKSPLDSYVNDVLTVPASLAGIPAMSIPVIESTTGAAIGLQLLTQYGDEEMLFEVANIIENLS